MKNIIYILLFVFGNTFAQDYLSEEKSGYKGGFIPELKILDESLNFIVMGDFGRNGQYFQKEVAEQMGKASMTIGSDFTISVGDNFYPNGVQSTTDHQWISSFENIYTNHSLYENWYVALGNHDYKGNIQAQIDYSKISRRWKMPAKYYSETFELKDGNKVLLVVMDTNPFIDSYHKKGTFMYENIIAQDTIAQKKWLIETLNTSDKSIKWKIVGGHHPLYSGGKRKDNPDTKGFEKKFAGIFDQYKVDAYLCGHEHDLQVIKPKGRYTTQFLSGSACEIRPTGYREGTLFSASEPGFMTFSINAKKLQVQAVNEKGKIIYTTEINK
ncbi:ribosomal protein L31 [Flavobacterium arsenatis]|uniref:acid phosphatase n=1 Tax=Flavobacterium arsenatis TaxID=1484332 RepID=A0ABU1TQS3_9FLAO|nr:metallophosphoesterase [Flavobacterium arsenatis]MDR6967717.1 ribosomal protein L31 [Flavobacterium arsenatis]